MNCRCRRFKERDSKDTALEVSTNLTCSMKTSKLCSSMWFSNMLQYVVCYIYEMPCFVKSASFTKCHVYKGIVFVNCHLYKSAIFAKDYKDAMFAKCHVYENFMFANTMNEKNAMPCYE